MSKRMLFVLVAVILAAAGLYVQWSDTAYAKSQVQAIEAADQAGQSTTADIASLKTFVANHMGTSVQIQLSGSYHRAQAAASAASNRATTSQQSNAQVYADAQQACMSKANSIVQAECNAAYLQAHLNGANPSPTPSPVPQPQLARYQMTLTAPTWTPDLAGSLMVGSILALGLTLIPTKKG